jgi:hypothetical protein
VSIGGKAAAITSDTSTKLKFTVPRGSGFDPQRPCETGYLEHLADHGARLA